MSTTPPINDPNLVQFELVPSSNTGMVNRVDARQLAPGASERLLNVVITNPGRTEKREGSHEAMISGSGISGVVRSLTHFRPDDGSQERIVEVDYTAVRFTNTIPQGGVTVMNSWVWATGVSGSHELTDNTDPTDTFAIQALNRVFIFNAGDDPRILDTGAQSLTHYPSAVSTIPRATCAEWMQQRLFVAGLAETPNYVYYSTAGVPWEFDRVSDAILFDVGRDSKVIALRKWKEFQLIVFMEKAIEMLVQDFSTFGATGIVLQGYSVEAWRREILEANVGCIARDSVQPYGDEMIFLSDECEVRTLVTTVTAKQQGIPTLPISEAIKSDLPDGVNKNKAYLAQGIVFDDKYFLAYPSTSSSTNDRVAVFDLKQRGWTLFTGLSVGKWLVSDLQTSGRKRLYYSDGATLGKFYEVLDGFYRDQSTTDVDADGSAITYEDTGRSHDFGTIARKTGSILEVEAEGDQGATLNVGIILDEGAEQSVGTIAFTGTGLFLPFTLDDNGTPPQLSDQPRITTRFHLERFGRWTSAQLVFREATAGKVVKFVGYRLGAYIENLEYE